MTKYQVALYEDISEVISKYTLYPGSDIFQLLLLTERDGECSVDLVISSINQSTRLGMAPSELIKFHMRSIGNFIDGDGTKKPKGFLKLEEIASMKKTREIIAKQAGVDIAEVTEGASLINDLGYDSLDVVELILKLEREFSIEIPYDDAEKIMTVKEVLDYVEEAMG